MKSIEYRIGYNEHQTEYVTVRARDINSGFTKALRRANEPLGNGKRREIASISFFMVKDA